MSVLNDILRRRVLIIVGKGGVGSTAVSAAIALVAASGGKTTLALECDPRAPLAMAFSRGPSFEPVAISPGLETMVLDGRHSLEEYLRLVVPARAVLNAVFSSKLYQYFVQAAPGLRELMMLGKLHYEAERRPDAESRWQTIVLDAPASGQALSILKMPFAAHETFGESIVGREARKISRMLRDQRLCAVILVTTPEPLAIAETLETHAALGSLGLKVGAIFLNRYNPDSFGATDVARFARQPRVGGSLKNLHHIVGLARAQVQRAALARQGLSLLVARTQTAIIRLPDHRGLSGQNLARRLASDLRVPHRVAAKSTERA